MTQASTSGREPVVDALRAWAMIGVLTVNALSYSAAPWGPPLGWAQPAGSAGAMAAQFGVAAVLHGKAYPLLAFLFGASLVLAARRDTVSRQRQRLARLLLLGVLHGALIYFGDILTIYALCGLLVLRHARERPARLLARWRRAALWAVAALALNLWLVLGDGLGSSGLDFHDAFGAPHAWVDHWRLNARAFGFALLAGLVLFLPLVRWLMLSGMVAARFRLLTHRRWRAALDRFARGAGPWALALNLAYAAALVMTQDHAGLQSLCSVLGTPASVLLSAVLVAAFVRGEARGWLQHPVLLALGRRTLSLYVVHSLLCVLLLSGAGAAWGLGTVAVVIGCGALWLAAAVLASWSAARRLRWPLEVWLGRP